MRRVVITGMGAVTPLGNDLATTWQALLLGQSGVRPITRFDVSDYAVRIAGEVRDFALDSAVDPREARRASQYVRYALNASLEALRHAQLDTTTMDRERLGVIILSALIAHTAWHWMLERGEALLKFPFPTINAAFAASAMRGLMALGSDE